MKIRILGCSSVELPNAKLSSFLIDGKILLDAGTIGGALDENEQWKIKHVLLTHAHLDHVKDLPFFADNISMNNKKHRVTVMSIPKVIRVLKNSLFNDNIWPDFTKIPDSSNSIIRFKEINTGKTFRVDGYKVVAYKVNHSVPAVGYLIEDKKNKKLLYMGDSGPSKLIWESLNRTKIQGLIIEVSLPNRLKNMALKTGHLTPMLLKEELRKISVLPDNIYITHYKPVYSKKVKEELRKLKIKNLKLLKDGETHSL